MFANRPGMRALLWVTLAFTLLAVVIVEGYYIFVLRDTIGRQSEELNQTSMQIQVLRQEKTSLEEDLQKIKNRAGEQNNGTTPQR
ncbi:MAG: hypothetical protein M0024_00490 [Nitrospiraceae bacterium]|nr:hypothetical protein [Nitrospiraceae bacterium]